MYLILNTITALLHEHMYDQLNDGKESKQVQERPYKRNWTDKSDTERSKKRPDYQKQKQRHNRCGQGGAPKLSRQHVFPAKMAECRKC